MFWKANNLIDIKILKNKICQLKKNKIIQFNVILI